MSFYKMIVQHAKQFNYDKYWSRFYALQKGNKNKLILAYYKYYLKKTNFKNSADIGLPYNGHACFNEPPILGNHGIIGIVIASGATIGRNCRIEHQVTIGRSRGGAPTLGDNVYIGAGAKIIGGIIIGDNVRIGANCVVWEDIPSDTTVVLPRPRVIYRGNADSDYYVADESEIKGKG